MVRIMICPHCKLEDLGGLHSSEFCIENLAEVMVRMPITGMVIERKPVDHEAYRKGLCCDCSTVPHSAGRPRCAPCHEAFTAGRSEFKPKLGRDQVGVCGLPNCSNPTLPGYLRCGPHCREIGLVIKKQSWAPKPWKPRKRPAVELDDDPGPEESNTPIARSGIRPDVRNCPSCSEFHKIRPCYPGCSPEIEATESP